MLSSKIGCDEGDPFSFDHPNQWHDTWLVGLRSNGGDLDNGPAQDLGKGMFAPGPFQQYRIQTMDSRREKYSNRLQHNKAMEQSLKGIGGYYFSSHIVTGPSLWISTSM